MTYQSDFILPSRLLEQIASQSFEVLPELIYIDPWWNPAVGLQASDRTHRIGKDKPVFVYKLITRDSVEEKIVRLQERKKSLVEQLITTESSFFKDLSVEDVKALFS
jgi:non-specific serine/threonine protein kinase